MAEKYRYREGFTFEGKRYDVKAKTERELIEKIAKKKYELEEGKKKITKNILAKDWFPIYLETYRAPSVGADMLRDLKSQYRVWIGPNVGNMQLKDIKPIHCQSILNSMSGKSKTHIVKIKQLLYNMLDAAIDNNLLIDNPAKKLTLPKAEAGTHRPITDTERAVLLKVAETNPYGLWLKTMLFCGVRPGETSRILGMHIDIKKKRLFVDGTKSKSAKRWVPIPDVILKDFAEAKSRISPFDHLFVNQNGSPINRTNRRRMWKQIKRDANILMGCKVFRNAVVPPFWVAPRPGPLLFKAHLRNRFTSSRSPDQYCKRAYGTF